jgi:hypothetical protein
VHTHRGHTCYVHVHIPQTHVMAPYTTGTHSASF